METLDQRKILFSDTPEWKYFIKCLDSEVPEDWKLASLMFKVGDEEYETAKLFLDVSCNIQI